jgi:hypothetical protein
LTENPQVNRPKSAHSSVFNDEGMEKATQNIRSVHASTSISQTLDSFRHLICDHHVTFWRIGSLCGHTSVRSVYLS